MKRYSSYVIKEMQIKTMRYHYTAIKMAKIWNTDNTKHWQGCETTGTLIHCCLECKIGEPLSKTVWQLLTKLKTLLPYHPAIMILGIYPKELNTYVHIKACTQICVTALFIIAKIWKQSRCPSLGEWIKKLWYIQTTDYYSVLKRNKLSSHENT